MTSKKSTQKIFQDILSFKNDKEKLTFEAEMIHLDIMHQIEYLMKEHRESGINKTELAKKLGVTKGYLTQLFTGDKLINLKTLAKLQRIFRVKFDLTSESIDKLKLKKKEIKFQKPKFVKKTINEFYNILKIQGKTYKVFEVKGTDKTITSSENNLQATG